MRRLIPVIVFSILLPLRALSVTDTLTIPVQRQYFHDKVDVEQKQLDRLDGKTDRQVRLSNHEEVNARVSDVLFRKVDELQVWVERQQEATSNNDRIKMLGYVENELRLLRLALKKKEIQPTEVPFVMERFTVLLKSRPARTSIVPYIEPLSYAIASIQVQVFADQPGITEARRLLYFKHCQLHPDQILTSIKPYVREPFADSLITIACRYNPAQLYTYAQSVQTPEGKLIHQSANPLVQLVARLSQTPNALLYFPFLDDIVHGRKTIEQLKRIVGDGEQGYDSVAYYKMLVATEIEYFRRISSPARDTPIAMFGANGLREMLKDRAIRHFITPINQLHNESSLNVRMRALDSLNAREIYYMIVMGENDIFTSSFKHSFNRMLFRLGQPPRGDSLLLSVHFDYFKKFIKMSANYNRLDTFLRLMPPRSSEALMKAFVSNLDESANLEDATDVADSYSSIINPRIRQRILANIEENENECIINDNERGAYIYRLLKDIFLSEDSTKGIDLSEVAGIPSIYEIPVRELMDDSGRIVQQVFFYGDEDGKAYFGPFLNSFPSRDWKIVRKPEWVEIRSLKGNIWIYANMPLDYDANLDDSAQVHLNQYLEENEIYPNIVIHRGHSYWLPGTISRMPINAKIVLLGSCGGYKNLNKILSISPEAHIISTKEIGAGDINRPIMNQINQSLMAGDRIVWKDLWRNLTATFQQDRNKTVRESWDSYVPPYRNLGAIFIKAYQKNRESF